MKHSLQLLARNYYRTVSLVFILSFFVIKPQAQVDLEGEENIPVRITTNPQPFLFGGSQTPPYRQMATFLKNAFNTPQEGILFLQDSSVCSNGIPNTNEFEPFLIARYAYEGEQLQVIEFFRINETGTRTPFSRKQFTYEGNHLKQYLYSKWNQGPGGWNPESRERFLYDESARIEAMVYETWDGSEWMLNERTLFQYTAEGRIQSLTRATWTGDMWGSTDRILAEYNENQFPTVVTYQENRNDTWVTTQKETSGYDEDFAFIQESYLLEVADENSGELVHAFRERYTYNLRGFFSERTQQIWNDTTEIWENVLKDLFTYAPIGIWTRWDQEVWDGKWKPALIREFKLNNGFQVDAEQAWFPEIGEWVNTRRRLVQYDDFGNLVREKNRDFWNPVTNDWVNGPDAKQCRHFWSEKSTTHSEDLTKYQMECRFMNPYLLGSEINCISEELNGNYRAQVYDQTGRLIHQQSFPDGETFSIQQDMPMGLYYMVIRDATRTVYRSKLVVQD